MKVLMASFTFPPNKDGVSEAASAIVLGYLEQGWEVDVLTESLPEPRESLVWRGASIAEFHRPRNAPLTMAEPSGCSVEEFLSAGNWDLLIFHAYPSLLYRALPILDKVRGYKVLVSHGFPGLIWNRAPRFPWGLGAMFRRCGRALGMTSWIRKFDRVVYLSEHSDLKGFYDHWLAKLSRYPGRVIIPNGVDPEERGSDPAGFRSRHGISSGALLFLCVANYSPRKDQAYAARAFRRAAISDARLVFIGSELNQFADRFIEEDRSSMGGECDGNILWLERVDREETLNAFAACDAFLLSASHEAQPISLLEAMRESKPWIARVSGCIELMEGGVGVRSEAAMAQAMIDLAADPARRARLGREGREAVESKYSRDHYLDSYVRLARELVETPSQTGGCRK